MGSFLGTKKEAKSSFALLSHPSFMGIRRVRVSMAIPGSTVSQKGIYFLHPSHCVNLLYDEVGRVTRLPLSEVDKSLSCWGGGRQIDFFSLLSLTKVIVQAMYYFCSSGIELHPSTDVFSLFIICTVVRVGLTKE